MGTWLADPTFAAFQPERAEDVDVRFGTESSAFRDYHQVKSGDVTPAAAREVIRGFQAETGAGSVRRLVIASPHLDAKVRSLAQALDRLRASDLASDPEANASTTAAVRGVISRLKLSDDAEFILEHVDFFQDFGALLGGREADPRSAYDRVAVELRRLVDLRRFTHDELTHAARHLVISVDDGGSRTWTRAQVLDLLRSSAEEFRAGPPRARADLILVRHDSAGRVVAVPDHTDLADLFRDRRILPVVDLDQTAKMSIPSWAGVRDAIQELVQPAGPFRTALAVPSVELLYFGLPHVPLAALAGYLARQDRHVHLVEHDRSTGRFRWGTAPDFPPLSVTETRRRDGSAAVLRVSLSAEVVPEVCLAVLDPADVRLDLEFRLPPGTGGRGMVQSEAQARAYSEKIRRALDMTVAGHPEFTAIHVFAAVPVSVAFLLGQALFGSALPEIWVHNYRHEDRPSYKWSIGLHGAERGEPGAVRIEGE